MDAERLIARLGDLVGAAQVRTDPALRADAERDWTGRWHGEATAVVRPGSTAEAAAVVDACAEAGADVVAQGGNTGLVGGAVPRAGAVVISTARLDTVDPVDVAGRRVAAGAGATLAAVQTAAGRHGLAVGVDFAARATATVGGMAATNAGGVHVVAHGMMRAHVAGLEAVLPDGRVLDELRGLDKDNTGYDLTGLLVGSEGTLGLITRLRLRLVDRPAHRAVALVPGVELEAAVAALPSIRATPGLQAVEWVDAATAALVAAHPAVDRLVGEGPWLLVEVAGDHDGADTALATALHGLPGAEGAAVAVEPGDRGALWAHREAATDAVAAAATASGTPVRKLDVTVPVTGLARVAGELPRAVTAVAPRARVTTFGHVADGNLHVQLLDVGDAEAAAAEDAVFDLVVTAGGSVSAEHGIGVAKRRWLTATRSVEAVSVMSAIKRGLDPHGRFNPGVLVDP